MIGADGLAWPGTASHARHACALTAAATKSCRKARELREELHARRLAKDDWVHADRQATVRRRAVWVHVGLGAPAAGR